LPIEFESHENNFYKIRSDINDYWQAFDTIPKSRGYKQFKRWEWFWEQRLYPTGKFTDIEYSIQKKQEKSDRNKQLAGNWSIIGPSNSPGGYAGLGRVNVSRSPSNENIIYAGAASGGLWRTINNGQTWTTNTDNFASLGISDIVISPSNNNIIYLATGDDDAGSTFSTGVLKSTNGGTTWNTTGLTFQTSQIQKIYKLVMHPTNPQIIYAAGTNGIDKTTNGGTSWTNLISGLYFDIKLKPGDPNTVYIVNADFFKSTDAGSSWEQMTTGFPSSNISRIAIDVTSAAPENVYALASNDEFGFGGFYVSTNSGNTWQNRSNTPNILGWTSTGTDAGGQGWYDLSLAVSPVDENLVYVGGINIWRSENGGTSWALETMWYPINNISTVHADHHDLWFVNGSTTLYSSNDGGIYRKRLNGNWEWLGNGLQITQFYRMGSSATDSLMIVAGSQDNGTKLRTSEGFSDIKGGDGMDCLIDYQDAQIIYATLPFGALARSDNGGENFQNIKPSTARGNWVTPVLINPLNPSILYVAYEDVYKTYDRGYNWTKISNFNLPSEEALDFLAISESDTNVIFAGQGDGMLMRTLNRGQTWQTINKPVNLWITSIAIHPNDPNRFILSFSGYTPNQRVYQSSDGGNSWQNITGSLPSVPINQVIYEKNSPGRFYAATDIGVYFRDNNNSNWVEFSDGLPNVVVTDMEIQYESKMLRAATYGRGLWETPLVQTTIDPDYSGDTNVCRSSTIRYIANSFSGVDNSWVASGGTIQGSSNKDTVFVTWGNQGNGSLKLIQDLSGYKDSVQKIIHILSPSKGIISGSNTACMNTVTNYTVTGLNAEKKWSSTNGTIEGSDTSGSVNVVWTNNTGCVLKLKTKLYGIECYDSTEKSITVQHVPHLTITGIYNVCPKTEIKYTSDFITDYDKQWKIVGGKLTSTFFDSTYVEWDDSPSGKLILILTSKVTGCKDSTILDITKNTLPILALTGNLSTCKKSLENYSSPSGNYSYKWSAIGGRIIDSDTLNNSKVLWDSSGLQSLRLIKTDRTTGCINDSTYTVNVQAPIVAQIAGKDSVCSNTVTSYSISKYSGHYVGWLVTNGTIAGPTNDSIVVVRWNNPGTFLIRAVLTNNQTGCTDTVSRNFVILPLPNGDFTGMINVCGGCTEKYISKEKGYINNWNVIGGVIIGSKTDDSVSITWNTNGPASLNLVKINTSTNCKDSVTKFISISSSLKPSISGDSNVCQGETIAYSTSSSNKFTNKWFVKNGAIIGPDNTYTLSVKWDNIGGGEVKVVQTNNETIETDSTSLSVVIDLVPPKPTITRTGMKLISSAVVGNQWYINKSKLTGETGREITPQEEGTYNVDATNNNCKSEISNDYDFSFSSADNQGECISEINPNPASSELSIISSDMCGDLISIQIFNSEGQLCTSRKKSENRNVIRIEFDCSSGVYFAKLKFRYFEQTIPFIINK
jgi:hypothetical protein